VRKRAPGVVVTLVLVGGVVGMLVGVDPSWAGHPRWWPTTTRSAQIASDGVPRDARLTIPRIGIHRLKVVDYRGVTDDASGTRIQNRGIAASPHGPHGGVGPGGIGNYQVTAHRTAHGGVFRRTPSLPRGARILVDVGRWRYVYRVVRTRWVDFRSARSLRRQRAAVPGHPGARAHRGYLTLSTCATPEDHARGDFWTDRLGNPQHRIDKIAVLVRRVPRRTSDRRGSIG
jgi:sortase A